MIVIEGNIGSGKTTLGKILAEEMRIPLYEELTSDFTGELLQKFYKDKKKWSFELQVHFLAERFAMMYSAQNLYTLSIMDRSLYGDSLFAETLCEDGDMSDEQHEIYLNLLDKMLVSAEKPTLLVYLRSSTDKLMERISERSRGNEDLIERSYIDKLNQKYNTWVKWYTESPVLDIDKDNLDLNKEEDRIIVLNKIENYLK